MIHKGIYDAQAQRLWDELQPDGLILIVHKEGESGISCKLSPHLAKVLPILLREMASGLEKDFAGLSGSHAPASGPKPIETEFQGYMRHVLPDDVSEIQLRETRRAFHTGAAALFQLLRDNTADDGPFAAARDLAFMHTIQAEINAFAIGEVAQAEAEMTEARPKPSEHHP